MADNNKSLEELYPALKHKRQAPSVYFPINDDIFGLNKRQKELRQLVFNFVQNELKRKTAKKNKDSLFADIPKLWLELGKLGLLGIKVKEEYGGTGGCHLDHVIIQEEISRVFVLTGAAYGNHTNYCVQAIHQFGNEEQKRKYLPKLCSGEHVGSMVNSDPQRDNRLMADKQGDYYIINGSGHAQISDADIFIVIAMTNRNIRLGFSIFIVEKRMKGYVELEDSSDNVGLYDCRVSAANMLGEKNKGVEIFLSCSDLEDMVLAGGTVGLMQALCDVIFQYAFSSKRFNVFKDKIAEMYSKLIASRNYLYTVARACDNGQINRKDNNATALFCMKNLKELAVNAKEVLGENTDTGLIRLLGDVKFYQMSAGTNDVRRLFISQIILHEYTY